MARNLQDHMALPDEGDGEGSTGSQGGHIEFVDFITVNETKNFTEAEIKVLTAEHNRVNKVSIEKQQRLREARAQYKQQASHNAGMAYGMGGFGGGNNQYKTHPLSQEAQFSGDRQNMQVPTLYEAQTQENQQEELQNRYQHQNQLRLGARPSFNPRPQFSK